MPQTRSSKTKGVAKTKTTATEKSKQKHADLRKGEGNQGAKDKK